MTDPKQQVSKSRRQFLRDAGVSGGIAAIAAAAPGTALAEVQAAEPEQAPTEGYRLTRHILDYYKSAST